MSPMRVVLKGWVAFLGAVALGFAYLSSVPPLSSTTTETLVVWGMVGIGAAAGLALEAWVVSLARSWRAEAGSEDGTEPLLGEALVGS